MRRRLVSVLLLGLVAAACTEPVERVTEILSPSPATGSAPTGTTGERLTQIVGEGIVVETPFANGDVGSPVSVTGTADVLGAEVTVRVLDGRGNELAQSIVKASCGDGCAGGFAAELFFFVEEAQPGWVEVSGASPEGPAPRVRVPVTLFP